MNPSEIITNYLDDLTDEVVYSHASDIDTVAYVLGKLYNQPTTTFTPLETVQTGACTYKIFVYKSADISYNESAML